MTSRSETSSVWLLDDEHLALREVAADVADRHIAPRAADVDDRAEFPEQSLRALIAADLHAVGIPQNYGGQGGDHLASAIVAEQIARACATTQQVAGGNELFAMPLLLAGSDDLKKRYLPPIASGDMLGAFALTEPEAGSDVAALRTRARPVAGGWLLKGTKRWITNAGRADVYVVFASTDPDAGSRGISTFVVEAADEGISYGSPERKMGLKGSPTRGMTFEDVFIPADRLIGDTGRGLRIALGTLDRSRTTVAAQAVGIAQGALDIAVAYAGQRRQFGTPISEFQGIQFLAADMATRVEASRLLTWSAARAIDGGHTAIGAAGAMAKCFASDTAMAVTTDAVQILGGSGYVKDYPVERMMRDAKITQIYEGTNQIQRIVIARHLFG
ncbi:acyl-CoA dehydrogenase family protein [Mycolicibacterium sp. 120266]|uniref:acyl-CoA dehydrogenase family protein n=1 Tax=Mycolicibacterium sp. 120266 TaxID=3090601 RepID=UPI00299F1105|nr:acyl-CoA dehydrogenase family protein [Mycolicibacterium sp. 120266]MDX1876171.1 acyl-CoA dehydrogenase family protein [Mycolicibacterium sp. 120266]